MLVALLKETSSVEFTKMQLIPVYDTESCKTLYLEVGNIFTKGYDVVNLRENKHLFASSGCVNVRVLSIPEFMVKKNDMLVYVYKSPFGDLCALYLVGDYYYNTDFTFKDETVVTPPELTDGEYRCTLIHLSANRIYQRSYFGVFDFEYSNGIFKNTLKSVILH